MAGRKNRAAARENTTSAIAALLLAFVITWVFLFGCADKGPSPSPSPPLKNSATVKIPHFENYSQLEAAFKQSGYGRNYGLADIAAGIGGLPMAAVNRMVSPAMQSMPANSAGTVAGTVDYSRTNVQVEGVDEADIVKSDGKYVYAFSKNRLVIVDAYPADSGKVLSTTELDGISPYEMFVQGDKLLMFASDNYGGYRGSYTQDTLQGHRPYYYGSYGGGTVVQLYDIANRSSPRIEKELEFSGSYLTSRLIGKNAYFVINSYPNYYPLYANASRKASDGNNIIPMMIEDGVESRIAEPRDIGYLPPMPIQSFVTIASLNLDSGHLVKETIAGSAENVFSSENNIYLASTAWLPEDSRPFDDRNYTGINSTEASAAAVAGKAATITSRIIYGDTEKTVINRFSMQDGNMEFMGQGIVPGHVLNQFSMDEFEGNFRIATTKGQITGGESDLMTSNSLYILDQGMKTIGTLEGLAPGEKIYSARFLGERAYLVTFRKVDPLFVIDLSKPSKPKVLGKLKIPGYSDYLHPIDENHIIGIGKDAIDSGYGNFSWYQGMKMAIFDVSDVSNPKEMHSIVIGDRGTDSFALHNHKAFLYDKEKQLLVLPIQLSIIPEEQKVKYAENAKAGGQQSQGAAPMGAPVGPAPSGPGMMGYPLYGEPVFQGAFVYRVTLENGFEERGRITHVTKEDELKRGYYFSDDYTITRALYIGDTLYTLSERMLKANSLSTLKDIKEFAFE